MFFGNFCNFCDTLLSNMESVSSSCYWIQYFLKYCVCLYVKVNVILSLCFSSTYSYLGTRWRRWSRGRTPGTHWIRGWVGPRVGLDAVAKEEDLIIVPAGNWTSHAEPLSDYQQGLRFMELVPVLKGIRFMSVTGWLTPWSRVLLRSQQPLK